MKLLSWKQNFRISAGRIFNKDSIDEDNSVNLHRHNPHDLFLQGSL